MQNRTHRILAIYIMSILFTSILIGCPQQNKSATQQALDQNAGAVIIMQAAEYDALKAYTNAQNLYLPIQMYVKEAHPEINAAIIEKFSDAWAIIDLWDIATIEDKKELRDILTELAIDIAKQIDERNRQ